MNLDAYMIRKIAPRLFFAIVGINLSIYLCIAAVDIATVAGHGIGQLIRGPFDAAGVLDYTVDGGTGNIGGGAVAVLTLLGGIALFKGGGIAAVFFLLLPVFVLILTTLLTLALRQALIVLLTMASPIAIVLAVLPGTERYFKQWWDLFIKTLVVYPLISALFAVSDILVAINFNNGNDAAGVGGDAVHAINGLMFAFMPLVLIPFTFRFAGGVLGAFSNATGRLQSMANRASTSRLQKYAAAGAANVAGGGLIRNSNPKQRWTGQYLKNSDGEYIDEEGNVIGKDELADKGVKVMENYGFKHKANVAASRLANMHKIGQGWGGVVASSNRAMIRQAAALAETEEAKALKGFDDEMFVLANFGKSQWATQLKKRAGERFDDGAADITDVERAERRRNLNAAIGMMDAYDRKGGGMITQAAAAVELHGISTSYKAQYYLKDENEKDGIARDGDGNKVLWDSSKHDEEQKGPISSRSHDQMQQTIYNASNGQRGLGNWIAAQSISGAKAAGRYDMAASASAVIMYQEALRSGDATAVEKMKDYYNEMMVARITPAQATQGHPRAAEETATALEWELNRLTKKMKSPGLDDATKAELEEEFTARLADVAGYQDALSSAGSEAVGNFDKLMGKKIDGKSVVDYVEERRNKEAFVRRRREYGYHPGRNSDDMTEAEKNAADWAQRQSGQGIPENPTGGIPKGPGAS